MTGVYSIASFIVKLKTIDLELNAVGHAVVARACEMVAAEAKRVLGTEGYGWPALSAATLAHKMQSGMLLETGEMRDSIQWHAEGNQGEVGSNNDKAVWHEFGTSKIPPRPFLAGAAAAVENKIHKMAARAVMAVILGKGLHSSEMAELMHLLHTIRHVGHVVGEAMDTVLDGPDDENGRRRMTEAELPQRWLTAVDELGLLFANEPDEKVAASLENLRKNLNAEFCALFPSVEPEDMEAGVDCIIRSIQDRKHELERDAIAVHRSKN